MADDTVIGVIIGAHIIHALIGQGKPVAAVERLALGLFHGGDAVHGFVRRRHQIEMIKFFNEMEQNIFLVALLPGPGMSGPGGVAFGQIDGFGVGLLVLEPVEHVLGEGYLVEVAAGAAEFPGQFSPQRRPIESLCVFGAMGLGGAALHELALAGLDPRQRIVALGQFPQGGSNGKEIAQKILEMGRHLHKKVGFVGSFQLVRRGAGGQQPLAQFLVHRAQMFQEQRIDPLQSLTVVKVLEGQIVAK